MSRIKDLIHKKMPSTAKGKNGQEDHTTLQALKMQLWHNSLTEIKLGFDEVHFYSKRDVTSLIKFVKERLLHRLLLDKHSCLKSIRIGWRLPDFAVGPVLEQLIPLLMQDPIRVSHIHLNLNTWVPEDCLRRIVSCPTIESLDLRAIRVRVPISVVSSSRSDGSLQPFHRNQRFHSEGHNVQIGSNHDPTSNTTPYIDKSIIQIIPFISVNVQCLKLIDCDLNRQHVAVLCDIIRRKLHCLRHLSLRHNRNLDGGFNELFNLHRLKSLDLSLCDLDASDGYWLGKALEQVDSVNQGHGLEKLCLAGNYRMARAIPDLVSLAAIRLKELDCSFCEVHGKLQQQVFGILASSASCTLRSFAMKGTRLHDVSALAECIRSNTSLRRLVLDHPREPLCVNYDGVEQIFSALKENYSIQVLKLDIEKKEGPMNEILVDMEFWLDLNRCGRRAILPDNKDGHKGWQNILAQAAAKDDVNVLFWLVKHGSQRIFH